MTSERRGGSFFGRRKGRPLRPGQRQAIETVLPKLLIDLEQASAGIACGAFRCSGRRGAAGDRLRRRRASAARGAEQSRHRLHRRRAVRERARQGGDRDRARGDPRTSASTIRTRRCCSTGCRRHRSRGSICSFPTRGRRSGIGSAASSARPISTASRACLSAGGEFRFATDVESYAEWTREEVAKHGGLDAERAKAPSRGSDWPGTRYEAKARGRVAAPGTSASASRDCPDLGGR